MQRLFTIGYEGSTLEDFLATLDKAGIDVLLDVRELPMSRRKGFSKTALSEALFERDIDYRHEKFLGSPKPIRHKLREDGNYKDFFRSFNKHLRKHSEILLKLAEELGGNVAIMCYEKDHTRCHRITVVDALSEILELTPVHLEVKYNGSRKACQKTYMDLSQGLSTA